MIYSEQKDAAKTVNNIENLLFRMEEESGDPEYPESCYVKSTSATTIDEEDLLRYSRSQTPTAESDKIENEDESCARSLRFFENPFEYPENESERKKLISVALQQEDEFLEYLMSLPAVTKEKQADQTAEAHHPEPPGFMRSTSTYSSSSGGPKVGLDHLDNLCKLMEQLGDLRDQNSKLQRKVQYLEDIKNLQEMHKQLHQDTKQRRLQDEELLKILLHSHRNRGPGSTHIKRHVRREEYEGNLTDSCLLDHGGSEESLSNIKTEPTMNTRSTKCKSISHSKMRQYLMHSHQRGRSRSVGIEELKAKDDDDYDERRRSKRHEKSRQRRSIAAVTGGSCKSKVSKWTKVKEAFRWEKASATMLPDSKSTDSGIGVVSSISCDDSKHLKVPPPESLKGDHSPNLLSVSPVDSVLSGLSSSVCSSGGQSPGSLMCHPLRDFGVTAPGNLSSSSSSDDLEIDLNFNDMFAELGPQRSASATDSRSGARRTLPSPLEERRMSLNNFPEEDEASRRSKSLDGETTIIARHFSGKESMGKMNKIHKTPWGKVKDIIQTRKDSLKRKHRGGRGVGSDPEEDAAPESEDEQYDANQPQQQQLNVVTPEEPKRQHCKVSTGSLGSPSEQPHAGRRLTPTLTITLPSTEELRGANAMVSEASKVRSTGSPQLPEERQQKASTVSAPPTTTDDERAFRRQVSLGRSAPSSTGASPPISRRAASKWTKVKKAFLTSAPGVRREESSGSAPSSPSKHTSFIYDVDPDDLYGGDFTDGATEAPGTTSASSPLSQSPPSNIHLEIQKNYEELQQKLSLEFHKKLHEWERIKSTANSMTSQSSPMSVGGSRCVGPVPPSSGCGVDDIGYSFHDKSFRRKMEEWERMKNPTPGSSTKHRDSVALHILHEDNLSPHFRKKLHEWQRMKKLLPQEGAPVPPQMKKRLAEWQLWRTGSSKGDTESGHRGVEEHSEDYHKKLQDWERAKFASASSSPEHAQEQSDGAKTPSPGVVRKNSGGGKSKLAGSGAKTPIKSKSPKEKELHWLEKELHKIEREKHRLEREREKFLEREARLEKMRLAMGSTPKKQEVLIQTSTGFFRFQGISEKFTRRLYEWEKARGIGPEASTFALLTPGYKASLVGHHTAFTGDRDVSDGAILPRCKSASSVSNMITTNISHHQSSLSLNDVGVLEHVGVVAAALEESRAASEPHLRSNASDEEPGAVIVDVEDVEEETAAPLLVAHEVQGHMPVYCYAPSEVTRLIDSSGSESDKDTSRIAQRRDSVRTESSYKLIEENISLINKLRLKEDICRKLENEIEDLEGEIDNVAKTHKEELEKLRIEESDLQMQDEDLEASLSQEQLVKKLRNRIEELEQWQERLEREGDTLQNSFVQHSEQQAALAQNLVGKMKLLQEANTNMAPCEETTGIQEYQSDTQEASLWLSDQEDVVAIAQDLSTQLLSLAEKLQVALTERNKELTSLRFQLRGHRRKQLPKFRCGHYWFSEEGMSASLGSLNNEIDEVSVLPRKNSQDLAQFPALLTYKVLELKRGLNYLHALSSSSSDGGVRHHETRAKYCIDKQELVTDEEPSASFVLRVRNKIVDEMPDKFIENDDFVQIRSEGNSSPVTSVTITPAFWKRRKQDDKMSTNKITENYNLVKSNIDSESKPNETMAYICSDVLTNKRDSLCSVKSSVSSSGEIEDLDVQKRDMTIDSFNDSREEKGIYNHTEWDSAKKSKYDVTSKDIETSKESGEFIQNKLNESKVTAISQFETEVLAAKEINGKVGKQKRLLRTRRVSDTNMGYRYKEAPVQSNVISRSRIKKKKETMNTELPRQSSCESEDNHKSQFSTSPDDKQSKNDCNLVSLDGTYLKEKLESNSEENVHHEEHQHLMQVDKQTVVTPIVRSKTTFLVGTCNTANNDPPVASTSANVFVPTTRKIFSPVRRDSKGKASSVISYVVEEPSIGDVAIEHGHSSGTQLSLQQTQATNGIQNSSSEVNNYKLGIDNSSPDKSESSNIIPPSWALRRNRSHSSSPCFQRRQLISSERKDKIIDFKEDSVSSGNNKCFAGTSRPSISGSDSSNSQNSFLNDLTNSNGKLDNQKQSQLGKFEQPCPFQASPLPQSPNPNRRELNRIASKEAAPSIRMMIAKYNQKLNEQDLTGGRSPEISGSGSGSPVAWRSPVAERRVKVQTEKYQEEVRRVLEQGGKKRTREVQKSASAGVIRLPEKVIPERVRGSSMKSEIAREENLNKPPLVVVLPKGILKSSSAGTIKPSLPLQFKVSVPNENKIPENSTVRNSIVPPPERFKDTPQNIEKSITSKPPSPRLNINTNTSSPFPTEHATNDRSTPFPRLRALKIKQAKEDFLSKGPGSQSWTSEVETPSISTSPEPSIWGSISRGVSIEERTSSGAQSRLSQVSMGSESSYESSNIVQGRSNGEDGLLLTKSVSAGMINLEPSAYRRLSSEPGVDGGQVSDGGTSTSSKLRFGISSIASKFRKVKMRKNKGRDTPKLNTVSMLCRQSLLIDLPISGGALSKGTQEDKRPCSSKSCPSSPVLQRSTSRTIMEEGVKTSSSWIRNPAKRIFKSK